MNGISWEIRYDGGFIEAVYMGMGVYICFFVGMIWNGTSCLSQYGGVFSCV